MSDIKTKIVEYSVQLGELLKKVDRIYYVGDVDLIKQTVDTLDFLFKDHISVAIELIDPLYQEVK